MKFFALSLLLSLSLTAQGAINFQFWVDNSTDENLVIRKVKYKIKNSSWEVVRPSKNITFKPGECTAYTGDRCKSGMKRKRGPWSVSNIFGECGHGQKRKWKIKIKCGSNEFTVQRTCKGNTRNTESNCYDGFDVTSCSPEGIVWEGGC